MKAKDLIVGEIYYVQSKYDCKSCFKVQVMMSKSLEPKLPDITPAANNTTIQNENHLEIQIEKVLDYNDIIRKMQQDNRVIKFMQEVTIGQAMGHGKYRKNMISL